MKLTTIKKFGFFILWLILILFLTWCQETKKVGKTDEEIEAEILQAEEEERKNPKPLEPFIEWVSKTDIEKYSNSKAFEKNSTDERVKETENYTQQFLSLIQYKMLEDKKDTKQSMSLRDFFLEWDWWNTKKGLNKILSSCYLERGKLKETDTYKDFRKKLKTALYWWNGKIDKDEVETLNQITKSLSKMSEVFNIYFVSWNPSDILNKIPSWIVFWNIAYVVLIEHWNKSLSDVVGYKTNLKTETKRYYTLYVLWENWYIQRETLTDLWIKEFVANEDDTPLVKIAKKIKEEKEKKKLEEELKKLKPEERKKKELELKKAKQEAKPLTDEEIRQDKANKEWQILNIDKYLSKDKCITETVPVETISSNNKKEEIKKEETSTEQNKQTKQDKKIKDKENNQENNKDIKKEKNIKTNKEKTQEEQHKETIKKK